jgi:hypothetical protein
MTMTLDNPVSCPSRPRISPTKSARGIMPSRDMEGPGAPLSLMVTGITFAERESGEVADLDVPSLTKVSYDARIVLHRSKYWYNVSLYTM